ncbi:hypothetical protein BDV33DRAFT_73437 [Aspergillus novoparasiticus]|uniref:Helicase/UvrB N-terminal domain-containing protein n=1 Tax=Aspergillus novoparasiticus TaxID=986946 RepID=A0A5N6E7E9_9EURO|nr:hypothetical protein BDV33DRAFT_73437 [Aspergillus novoparasiticus]
MGMQGTTAPLPHSLLSLRRRERKMDEFRSRSYQQEMLEMSLRENIIVVMDTGSGKTHMYASLRLNTVSSGGNNRENK